MNKKDALEKIEELKKYVEDLDKKEFKVGDRVVYGGDNGCLTKGMIYRIIATEKDLFDIIDDCGDFYLADKDEITPLEKPKVDDMYHGIGSDGYVYDFNWAGDVDDEDCWNYGNVFHTREQAEFARDRIKKFI